MFALELKGIGPLNTVRDFGTYRDELTLHNGVLFKNQRLIIPKALRTEVTSRIHSSHLGIEACLRKSKGPSILALDEC